jgi:hypothetical protein
MTLNPHRKDPSTGRTTLFTFLWVGGGYNQVYASDAAQAEEIANAHLGGGTANLRVRKGTVRAVRDEAAYHNSHPSCD